MDTKIMRRISGEMDTIVRVCRVAEDELVQRVCEWLDYEFHGVVPLPLERGLDRLDRTPIGEGLEEAPVPEKPSKKART